MDEAASGGRTRDRPPEAGTPDGAQSAERKRRRCGKLYPERGRNELLEAAEVPGSFFAAFGDAAAPAEMATYAYFDSPPAN